MAAIYGTTGSDVRAGTLASDKIFGYPAGGNPEVDLGDFLYGDAINQQRPGFDQSIFNGNDALEGGAGDDVLSGDSAGFIAENESWVFGGRDFLVGDSGIDSLYGDAVGDFRAGGLDEVHGGDDTLRAGSGNDRLYGDAGGLITSAMDPGYATTGETNGGGDDLLEGDDGDDLLYGDSGGELSATGGGRLIGGDWVSGGAVRGGDDALYGGDGNDTLFGDAGMNIAVHDSPLGHATAGNDRLAGGTGDDTIYGDAAGNIVAEQGRITLGGDTLLGGDGNDTLYGDVGGTITSLGTGTVDGGADRLYGDEGNDALFGGFGNDRLYGGDGADTLHGDEGDDCLAGNAGNDTIDGGLGKDRMSGGAGADSFVFKNLSDSGVGSQRDAIVDFTPGEDLLNLSAIDTDGAGALTFIGTAAFTHHAGELHYIPRGTTTYVEIDATGDGVADFQIGLRGNLTLRESDFVL